MFTEGTQFFEPALEPALRIHSRFVQVPELRVAD